MDLLRLLDYVSDAFSAYSYLEQSDILQVSLRLHVFYDLFCELKCYCNILLNWPSSSIVTNIESRLWYWKQCDVDNSCNYCVTEGARANLFVFEKMFSGKNGIFSKSSLMLKKKHYKDERWLIISEEKNHLVYSNHKNNNFFFYCHYLIW